MTIAEQFTIPETCFQPIDKESQEATLPTNEEQYSTKAKKEPLLTREGEQELAKIIEAGLFAEKLLDKDEGSISQDVRDKYELDDEENRALLEAAVEQGRVAKDQFINSNVRLVLRPAGKFSEKRGVPYMDCVQMGNLGLIRALEKFDYTKGYKFSTYAMWWIKQAMSREADYTHRQIRLTAAVEIEISKLYRTRRELAKELQREPTDAEIAGALNMELAEVTALFDLSLEPLSYDIPLQPDNPESGTLSDTLELDEEGNDPTLTQVLANLTHESDIAVAFLEQMHKEGVITSLQHQLLVHTFDGKNAHKTPTVISEELGLPLNHARNLKRSALYALRQYLKEAIGEDQFKRLAKTGSAAVVFA